ncbi:hypothetical protein MD484_g7666, partial [Candolleomyces efflorescens]
MTWDSIELNDGNLIPSIGYDEASLCSIDSLEHAQRSDLSTQLRDLETGSIGVSNFGVEDLKTLFKSAKIKPAVNQILLHPYVYEKQKPIIEYSKKHGIVIEAYSALSPLTTLPGGPLEKPLNEIAERKNVTPEQILLAWTKAKGAVVLTTSSKKKRLERYLDAGDLKLSDEEIKTIDDAGARGASRIQLKEIGKRLAWVGLLGALAVGFSLFSGVDVF